MITSWPTLGPNLHPRATSGLQGAHLAGLPTGESEPRMRLVLARRLFNRKKARGKACRTLHDMLCSCRCQPLLRLRHTAWSPLSHGVRSDLRRHATGRHSAAPQARAMHATRLKVDNGPRTVYKGVTSPSYPPASLNPQNLSSSSPSSSPALPSLSTHPRMGTRPPNLPCRTPRTLSHRQTPQDCARRIRGRAFPSLLRRAHVSPAGLEVTPPSPEQISRSSCSARAVSFRGQL